MLDEPSMCGSRKYPYPHHGGNWKFQEGGGGGDKGPGNSGGEGVLFEAKFTSRWKEINRLTSYVGRCRLPTFVGRSEVLSS